MSFRKIINDNQALCLCILMISFKIEFKITEETLIVEIITYSVNRVNYKYIDTKLIFIQTKIMIKYI